MCHFTAYWSFNVYYLQLFMPPIKWSFVIFFFECLFILYVGPKEAKATKLCDVTLHSVSSSSLWTQNQLLCLVDFKGPLETLMILNEMWGYKIKYGRVKNSHLPTFVRLLIRQCCSLHPTAFKGLKVRGCTFPASRVRTVLSSCVFVANGIIEWRQTGLCCFLWWWWCGGEHPDAMNLRLSAIPSCFSVLHLIWCLDCHGSAGGLLQFWNSLAL